MTESYAQQRDQISKVVIDPGHGGTQPGCVGRKSKEKDINLSVALKLGKLISDNFKDVKVIYTRKTDITVDLYKRAQIANNQHADLFISIHCNSVEKNTTANGIETFVMGLHKTKESMEVAKKENAAILLEEDYKDNYDGILPNTPEWDILISLHTSAYLSNSAIFAKKVQDNLVRNTKLVDRGVKQAGLWVLYKVSMPSILVELGFLSNAKEEEYLTQPQTHEIMAVSLYNAFVEYKNFVEGTNIPKMPLPTGKGASLPTSTVNTDSNQTLQPNDEEVVFKVQFHTSSTKMATNHKKFSLVADVDVYIENNTWKYTSGAEKEYEKASERLAEVKKSFPDAFIIAFYNGEKIPVSEALRLMKK